MENTSYYCSNCSNPWNEGYATDEPTVHGNTEDGWTCDICGCHTYTPEEDACVFEAEGKIMCDMNKLEAVINKLMEDNGENLNYADTGYDRGYAEGFHDALVDVMHGMGIETDEEYFN